MLCFFHENCILEITLNMMKIYTPSVRRDNLSSKNILAPFLSRQGCKKNGETLYFLWKFAVLTWTEPEWFISIHCSGVILNKPGPLFFPSFCLTFFKTIERACSHSSWYITSLTCVTQTQRESYPKSWRLHLPEPLDESRHANENIFIS